MITSPSTSKKTPSQSKIRGILPVGFRSNVRPQLSGFSLISMLTKRTDLGMTGVQVRKLRLPVAPL